jgi:hypothetical protein
MDAMFNLSEKVIISRQNMEIEEVSGLLRHLKFLLIGGSISRGVKL